MVFTEEHEDFLNALILCDPITAKGMDYLELLKHKGLKKDVTPEFFYKNDNLRAPLAFEEDRQYEEVVVSEEEQTGIFHEYTFDNEQFNKAKKHHCELLRRISGTTLNDPIFIFQGVTENGKSIEIHRLIRQYSAPSGTRSNTCSFILFDFEEGSRSIERGEEYKAWDDSISAAFCVIIFSAILKYVEDLGELRQTVLSNYETYMKPRSLGTKDERLIIKTIGEFTNVKPEKLDDVFSSLKKVTVLGDAKTSIFMLLRALMWIMFCAKPFEQHRIVIDNIENSIVLDKENVQIPDEDIKILYYEIKHAVNKMNIEIKNSFNRKESCFSAFFVVRRTTIDLLRSKCVHRPADIEKKAEDLTGQVQMWEIWEKKRDNLWRGDLENVLVDDEYNVLVAVMNIITAKGTNTIGRSYQALIASLMNYGIRRIGNAQAHAAFITCRYLLGSSSSAYTMGYERFTALMANAEGGQWASTRYMARRALLEIQFKWSASQLAWANLQIGYVSEKDNNRTINGLSKPLTTRSLILPEKNISMVSRILSYLSYHHNNTCIASFWTKKMPHEMFDEVSLYDLVRGVLVPPMYRRETSSYSISEEKYRAFAKTLIALANMDSDETKRSPYVILTVDDKNFHDSDDAVEALSGILERIVKSGKEDRKEKEKYEARKYNVRITEAGFWFLHRWLHSFSFMAAISCYTIPPLFFINNRYLIQFVIQTVYNKAKYICEKYEEEASAFLKLKDEDTASKLNSIDGLHLRPSKHARAEETFRNLVKTQHVEHLKLYQNYLQCSYQMIEISEEDKNDINDYINQYISKYKNWEGEKECF